RSIQHDPAFGTGRDTLELKVIAAEDLLPVMPILARQNHPLPIEEPVRRTHGDEATALVGNVPEHQVARLVRRHAALARGSPRLLSGGASSGGRTSHSATTRGASSGAPVSAETIRSARATRPTVVRFPGARREQPGQAKRKQASPNAG